jgi:hypothetical protein
VTKRRPYGMGKTLRVCFSVIILLLLGGVIMRSVFSMIDFPSGQSNIAKAESRYVDLQAVVDAGGLLYFEDIDIKDRLRMKTLVTDYVCDSIMLFEPEFLTGKSVTAIMDDHRWFTVQMSASGGYRAQLIFYLKDADESVGITLPIVADGKMRKYCVDLQPLYQRLRWAAGSVIERLGFIPSEKKGVDIEIDFMAFGSVPAGDPYIGLVGMTTRPEIPRAGETTEVHFHFMNIGEKTADNINIRVENDELKISQMQPGEIISQSVSRTFQEPGLKNFEVSVQNGASWNIEFPVYVKPTEDVYVPEPKIAETDYLIGVHYFPGWKQGAHGRSDSMGWTKIAPYPEREPLLGWYDEHDPEVTDWEIKWALEHGISFFVYCWYGMPDQTGVSDSVANLTHAIHEGLFNARYNDRFKFAINWCVHWGLGSMDELLNTIFPYWMENYFKKPYYLTVDNKPVLFIYDVENLIRDLGGLDKVRFALDAMREEARKNGFDGLYVMGHYWGWGPAGAHQIRNAGFDYGFAYINWPRWTETYRRPTRREAIEDQKSNLIAWANFSLPYVPTISVLWDPMPWYSANRGGFDDMLRWRILPEDFREIAEFAKEWMDLQPDDALGSKILLLDNWNEYGEGHYIAPHREYGFEYLDVIRDVFTTEDKEHRDVIPDEIGLGPYNSLYTEKQEHRVFTYPPLPVIDK